MFKTVSAHHQYTFQDDVHSQLCWFVSQVFVSFVSPQWLGPPGIAFSSSNITHEQFIWIIPMCKSPDLAHKQLTLLILSMVLRANKPRASSRFFLFFHQLVNGSRVDAGNRWTNNRDALCKGGGHLFAFLRLSAALTYIWIGLEGPSNKPWNFCLQNSIKQL